HPAKFLHTTLYKKTNIYAKICAGPGNSPQKEPKMKVLIKLIYQAPHKFLRKYLFFYREPCAKILRGDKAVITFKIENLALVSFFLLAYSFSNILGLFS